MTKPDIDTITGCLRALCDGYCSMDDLLGGEWPEHVAAAHYLLRSDLFLVLCALGGD